MPTVNAIDYGEDGSVSGYISSRLMAAYDFPEDHTLHISADGRDGFGRIIYNYVLEHDGATIFDSVADGKAMRFGVSDAVDYADAARTVLGFLTLRPGDTDADYFDDYTDAQCAWRDEHAECLSLYAMHPDD